MRTLILISTLTMPVAAFAASTEPAAPKFVVDALREAVACPGARLVIEKYTATLAPDCRASSAVVTSPPGSGHTSMLKLFGVTSAGAACEGWARVEGSISAPMLVTTRAVPSGGALAGAVVLVERPWRLSLDPVAALPDGAVATESLPAGATLSTRQVRAGGPGPGDTVTVIVSDGSVSVSQSGLLTHCTPGHDCATLPSGKRVEGKLVGDKLLVELP